MKGAISVSALNATQNLSGLCSKTSRPDEAKQLYLRARDGIGAVWGHSSGQQ